MKPPTKIFITVFLACSTLLAQHEHLYDAYVLEQRGQFDDALKVVTRVIESGQLSEAELGRAQIMLGFAYRGQGNFTLAQNAFERALRILEHDPTHPGDYASALENYAGLYSDTGQLSAAAPMWQKELRLREQLGDHAAAARSLFNLAGLNLARKRVRTAKQYLEQASGEMNLAHVLIDDDFIMLYETRAWMALAEGHASDAVAGYQRALELCIRTHGDQHWLTGWEHIVLGSAYSQSGDAGNALADMQEGLIILERTLGRSNPKYLSAEIAYSQVLDRASSHGEAARLRGTAERALKDLYGGQCTGCTINVAGFR